MSAYIHPRLALLEGLIEGLAYTAQQAAKAARKAYKDRTPHKLPNAGTRNVTVSALAGPTLAISR